MAKDKYTITNAVDIVGTLDQNQDEKLVVYVESGKGENMIIRELDIMEILERCLGMQIALKLTTEEDKCYE